MKAEIYTGLAIATGKYASQLEAKWARDFRGRGWDAEYVGNCDHWRDFIVDGVPIEIKPDGDKFVRMAMRRAAGRPLLIIEGDPTAYRWWVFKGWEAASLKDGPRQATYQHPIRYETIREYLARHNVTAFD